MLTNQSASLLTTIANKDGELGDAQSSAGLVSGPGADPTQHVVLVRPARVSSRGTWNIPFTPPLGLAYLAAVLRKAGFRVSIVDAMAEAPEQFLSEGNYLYQPAFPRWFPSSRHKICAKSLKNRVFCQFVSG